MKQIFKLFIFAFQVAMYFAWLGHYTMWLSLAALAGFGFWIGVAAQGNSPNATDIPYFCGFMAIWATMYVAKSSGLNHFTSAFSLAGLSISSHRCRPQVSGIVEAIREILCDAVGHGWF